MRAKAIRTIYLLVAFVGAGALAQNYPAETELGFHSLSEPGLPPAVVKAADSVLQLRVPAIGDEAAVREIDVANGGADRARKEVSQLDPKTFDELDKIVINKEIDDCERRANEPGNCQITYDIRSSTGFLGGDGSVLWTNGHAIDGYMTAIEQYGGVVKSEQLRTQRNMRVFAFRASGELVIDPYAERVYAARIPDLTFVAQVRENFYAEDSDYVALQLPRQIGRPLPFAAGPVTVGQRLFALGYPSCTGCDTSRLVVTDPLDFADRAPGKNSDGKGLKLTYGPVLDMSQLSPYLDMSQAIMGLWQLDRMLFFGADSNHGNSGGPVLNEAGQVVAIFTGALSRNDGGKYRRVSRAVIVPASARP